MLNNEGKLFSSREGVITKILVSVGNLTPNTACMMIADASSGFGIKLEVSSEEEKYISKDCKVVIKGKNNNGDEVKVESATISSVKEVINSTLQQEDAKQYEVTITSPEAVFLIGSNVLVHVQNESVTYETCVPVRALHQEGKNQYYVFVISEKDTMLVTEKVAQKLPVKVLDKNAEFAALEDNTLSNATKIIYTTDRLVQEGNAVREKVGDE